MYINHIYNNIYTEINIKTGISLLSSESGSGKTLLLNLITDYCNNNHIQYCLINYTNIDQLPELFNNTYEIVLLDNADRYITDEILEKLREISKYAIIVLKDDSKVDTRDTSQYLVHYNNLKIILEEI